MFENLFQLRGGLSRQQRMLFGGLGFLLFVGVWALAAELMADVGVVRMADTGQATDTRYIRTDSVFTTISRSVGVGDTTAGDSLRSNTITEKRLKAIIDADSLRGEEMGELEQRSDAELAAFGLERKRTYIKLPTPLSIISAVPTLMSDYGLVENTGKSVWVNILSYVVAILIALPLGFMLGLIPLFRGLFGQIFDAFRFIPLAAVTYIFILWFGIETQMKVAFLAFGILVYLVPVVVQRIDEVKDVYLKTTFTLGASTLDTIRTVYIPSVVSRLSDDVRVLTAISWTYITVAEMVNNTGGLGGMIFKFRRTSNIEYAFVVLIVIIVIGILQDYVLRLLDRILFPYKYVERGR